MNLRKGIGTMICTFGILSIQAQEVGKQDSLRSDKQKSEIYINTEAVKSIDFNFMSTPEPFQAKPRMSKEKPWMEFRKDLPISLNDTTTFRKKKYIRMLPYSIWGYEPTPNILAQDTLKIRMKLNPANIKIPMGMGHGYRVLPAGMDQTVTPSNNPLTDFSADKALFENFTKRGRAIRRNRKKAKAWRIYQDYVPTKEDSLKWWGNKKRIPRRDTLEVEKDSVITSRTQSRPPE